MTSNSYMNLRFYNTHTHTHQFPGNYVCMFPITVCPYMPWTHTGRYAHYIYTYKYEDTCHTQHWASCVYEMICTQNVCTHMYIYTYKQTFFTLLNGLWQKPHAYIHAYTHIYNTSRSASRKSDMAVFSSVTSFTAMCTYTCEYVNIYMYTCEYVNVCMYTCEYVHMCMHTCSTCSAYVHM